MAHQHDYEWTDTVDISKYWPDIDEASPASVNYAYHARDQLLHSGAFSVETANAYGAIFGRKLENNITDEEAFELLNSIGVDEEKIHGFLESFSLIGDQWYREKGRESKVHKDDATVKQPA